MSSLLEASRCRSLRDRCRLGYLHRPSRRRRPQCSGRWTGRIRGASPGGRYGSLATPDRGHRKGSEDTGTYPVRPCRSRIPRRDDRHRQDQYLELHFLDVHQGDSTLVVCPNGNRILVDAGHAPWVGEGYLSEAKIESLKDYLDENLSDPQHHTPTATHRDVERGARGQTDL